MPSFTFQGGCVCGHVRYQMTSNPLIVHGSHCRLCQRQTGTAFAQNALIESGHVELLQGDVEDDRAGIGQRFKSKYLPLPKVPHRSLEKLSDHTGRRQKY